jgi:hypothetical protein
MRTTLTLEPDVAAMLDQVRGAEGLSLKAAVNRALRLGLMQLTRPTTRHTAPYQTPVADTGRLLVPEVTSVARVLDFLDVDEGATGR